MRPFAGPIAALYSQARRGFDPVDLPEPHAERDKADGCGTENNCAKLSQPGPTHPKPQDHRGDEPALQTPDVRAALPDRPDQRRGEEGRVDRRIASVALEGQPRSCRDGDARRQIIEGAAQKRELRAAGNQQHGDHGQYGRQDDAPTVLWSCCGLLIHRSLRRCRSRREQTHGRSPGAGRLKRPTPARTD